MPDCIGCVGRVGDIHTVTVDKPPAEGRRGRALLDLSQQAFGYLRLTPHISLLPSFHATLQGDRNLSPVLGARQAHHLSRTSLRTETVV
ncbi:hypothetical protein E2C01_024493 [Portunus trituberculatus]|uniref:Uncharacterized protein n=1 Tax=Portunus trituberculatus TaxID=210409 RepID=A0A5B7EAS9_PORTR|nr:hypothetical protein [Portunus trituberculatus]